MNSGSSQPFMALKLLLDFADRALAEGEDAKALPFVRAAAITLRKLEAK